MPRLVATTVQAPPRPEVEFVFSPVLDMLNAMYFTRFAIDAEGVEGWPLELRKEMAPDLLEELDYLYWFPNGAGLMGQFLDMLWSHPEAWESIDSVIAFIRDMEPGIGPDQQNAGIQGLAYYLACVRDEPVIHSDDPREALRLKITSDGVEDVDSVMRLWDRPEELRQRMIRLIERFHDEHYSEQLPLIRESLEGSATAHRGITRDEAAQLIQKLTGRDSMCLEDVCDAKYERVIFSPSLDMGPYISCAALDGPHPVHGMFYPCEAEFVHGDLPHATDVQRTARLYKALSDEGRLRILHMLKDGELYAQEIVDKTNLHQSVVSRHLWLLKAVGLVDYRKQNNMKFYSLNPRVRDELLTTMDFFTAGR